MYLFDCCGDLKELFGLFNFATERTSTANWKAESSKNGDEYEKWYLAFWENVDYDL